MPALQVRLTDEEYQECRERSKAGGVSISEYVRLRLFNPLIGTLEMGQWVPPSKPAPRKVRKRAVPDHGAGVLAEEISEIPAFEELSASVEVARMPERLARLPDGTLITESQYEELLVTGNVVVEVPAPVCAECGEDVCICRSLENVEPPSAEVASVMASLPPVSLPEPKPRHNFKRHPKCTTEKCERFGNACPLCNLANAISF